MNIVGIYFKQLRTYIPYYLCILILFTTLIWIKKNDKRVDDNKYTIAFLHDGRNETEFSKLSDYISNYISVIHMVNLRGPLDTKTSYYQYDGYIRITNNSFSEKKDIKIDSLGNNELEIILHNLIASYYNNMEKNKLDEDINVITQYNSNALRMIDIEILGILGLFLFTISCFNMGSILLTIESEKIKDRLLLTQMTEQKLFVQLTATSIIFSTILVFLICFFIVWMNLFQLSLFTLSLYVIIMLLISMIGITLGGLISNLLRDSRARSILIILPILLGVFSDLIPVMNISDTLLQTISRYQPLYWFKDSLNLLKMNAWYGANIGEELIYNIAILLLFILVLLLGNYSIQLSSDK